VALAKPHLHIQTHYQDSNTQKYYLVVKRKKQESDEENMSVNAVNFYCVQDISATLKEGTMHTIEFFKSVCNIKKKLKMHTFMRIKN
jgi:hypothetical protein